MACRYVMRSRWVLEGNALPFLNENNTGLKVYWLIMSSRWVPEGIAWPVSFSVAVSARILDNKHPGPGESLSTQRKYAGLRAYRPIMSSRWVPEGVVRPFSFRVVISPHDAIFSDRDASHGRGERSTCSRFVHWPRRVLLFCIMLHEWTFAASKSECVSLPLSVPIYLRVSAHHQCALFSKLNALYLGNFDRMSIIILINTFRGALQWLRFWFFFNFFSG